MMHILLKRSLGLLVATLAAGWLVADASAEDAPELRVGIIGLDTSHAIAFTKLLNGENPEPELANCRVVAAYPKGSPDIESSVKRVPEYTAEVQKLGVEIVDSIDELLPKVDAVLLETNDGRPHLEQLRPVLAAGKPVFIDKPVAGSLADAITIFREARLAGVPVFSSSSLRYGKNTQAARAGSLGRVTSCQTSSPASLEATHPDLFWYGIHGVESLFTVMGPGCKSVKRSTEDGKIVVTGQWDDGRVGVFKEGKGYEGTAKGDAGEGAVGSYDGYQPLLVEIVKFFRTGKPPVSADETLEIYAFMEAADESKRQDGAEVALDTVMREAGGFTPLFNGKDLTGWKGLVGNPKSRAAMSPEELAKAQKEADANMREHWKVVDGALVFDGKGQSLCTAKDYGDFELYADWKILEAGDSGLYLRGSPQVQIWDTEYEKYFPLGAAKGSGAFWNNQNNPRHPSAHGDNPVGEWNTFHIKMIGERATIHLNGVLVVDNVVLENYWDRNLPIYPSGQIELQNHGNTLYFRNLYVREISADEANATLAEREADVFEPIFNGEDLTGWTGATDSYHVEDGAIVCGEGHGGTLFTEQEYDNFVVRCEFKLPPGGNNGLAIRYPGEGNAHTEGMCEIQILDDDDPKYATLDPRQYNGSVYGLAAAHRGYLRPTGEWNFQQVTVNGPRIQIELNGTVILDADVSKIKESKDGDLYPNVGRKSGHFGFAGHNDPVAFRNIAIRELPGAPAEPPARSEAISPTDGVISLFNGKNLAKFYSYTQETKYADPNKVFTVEDGMIHISGQGYGGLITSQTYRDYHLILEFKWGEKTWGDRADRARDSGLLLHCWGPDGGYGGRWMAGIEDQIIEGGVGDILVLSGTDPLTGQRFPTSLSAEVAKDRDGETVWKAGGDRVTDFSSGRINWFGRDPDWADKIGFRGKDDVESPHGEWTKMEVIADGGHLVYLVNGVKVNEAFDTRPDAGKLVLQTEQAEIFIRRFELWPIGAAPEE